MKKPSLVINLLGGPSAGKSTLATGIFHELKKLDVNCELVTEFAKDLTWEENWIALGNQLYVSANQIYRQERLEGKVDVIVSDSPIFIGLFYYKPINTTIDRHFKALILETFNVKNNLNIFVNRLPGYNPVGRTQTLEESIAIDNAMKRYMMDTAIPFIEATKNQESVIIDIIKERLKE